EFKNKQAIIEENARLKAKVNENNVKNEEEIKQIEGQLRIEVKQELNNKYGCIIEEVKNQVKASNEEKERYKKELEELKAKTKVKNENSEGLKENYKLISELRSISSGLIAISKQYKKMNDNNINISSDILEELKKAIMATSILDNIASKLN
ncbi:hypothetical protein NSA50_17975, partial [Clostridium sp. DSM 100503]|nr:hypothetical protein [Clostridium sp. DSM 100503]